MNRKICVGIILVSLATMAGAASVPNPTVIGPIPATAKPGDPSHNYPFFSATADLASQGYIEEEFFLDGVANRYNTPARATGSVIDGGHPYRTRMVVRRPASPGDFNGTVLMEMQVLGTDFEHDALWPHCYAHIMRRGYAWIGVSAQRLGIHQPVTGLRDWSPGRYGTLDVTQGGTILDDALSFDIFSQAAQAVRSPVGVDPMGGLHVERVFAGAAAQAANRLVTYHNSIHPLAGVFDAFLLGVGGGQLRTDLDVKVFKLLGETDVAGSQAAIRQPDSDHFRRWEVAGTALIDFHLQQELTRLLVRDNVPSQKRDDCGLPPLSRIPLHFPMDAAVDHVVRWVKDNVPPPTAPDIEIATLGPPVVVARDSFRNALGGIRLSQHAVPTATNTGANSGPGFCPYFGSYQPFDDATLNALYPSYNLYVIRVMQATDENLWHGFLVPEDALETMREAVYSDRGRR